MELSTLRRPRFLIFDYGETLAHEDDFCAGDGFRAALAHATHNPSGADAEHLLREFRACFGELRARVYAAGAEVPNRARLRWLFEMFELEFDRTEEQIERIFWDAAAPCVPTPGMRGLLARLRACGVQSGVVSNMGFGGDALRQRLERLYPEHRFRFVISSADYVLRKPNPRLFALALKKAGCRAGEAWFLGDHPEADVAGAAGIGLVPVYYARDLGCAYRALPAREVDVPCLRVEDWAELYPIFEDRR